MRRRWRRRGRQQGRAQTWSRRRRVLRRGGVLVLALGLAQAAPAPVPLAQAATLCPDWGGRFCYTRRMDLGCSPGAQESTVAVGQTLENGQAVDGEGPFGCGSGHVLHQYDNAAEDAQTALWRNITVRGGGRRLTACRTQWEAGNLHEAQTVVCAGGGEAVTVTIHPAE